jgi:hypothetical protein
MSSKASTFYNFVLKSNHLIYVIGETSFHPGICSTEFFGPEYVVYRCDRSPATSSKKTGGGVLIAVHSMLSNSAINLAPSVVEQTCVKVIINKKNVYIYTAYIPPHSSGEIYARCSDAISELINLTNSSDLVLALGDFNLPNVIWKLDHEVNALLPYNITSEPEWVFIDTMLGANLTQINTIPNEHGKFLDLCFANEADIFEIVESLTPFVVNDIYHKSMEIIFDSTDLAPNKPCRMQQTTYNFNKANHIGLQQYLETIKWDDILNKKDVNENVNQFYKILMIGFDNHIPMYIKKSSIQPAWFDDRLKNLKNRKTKAYATMIKSGLVSDKLIFLQYNDEFDAYFKSRYSTYLAGVQEDIKLNPKHFWKYFRSKREIEGYPSNMTYNNNKSTDAKEIADMFAAFFQSVYRPKDNNTNSMQTNINNNLFIVPPLITDETIMSALLGFGNGCGPDNLPSLILKTHANNLVYPLRILFNLSLETGVFPDVWKISKITPIFKSGKRDDVTCYRGISTTSAIPKLFELIVCNSFKTILARHISISQHGFIPGRSTSTNLVEFTNKVINEMEKHYQIDVVYTDFSKAFDSICHRKALDSLYTFGFSLNFVKWFSSYLTNRVQYVMIENQKSKVIRVTSGVPQGSHIGPWLFLIFIDRITEVVKNSNVLVFADDIKIFRTIKEGCDTDRLQEDINSLSEWCDRYSLHLNINKCKIMSFHRKKNPIINVYNINNVELPRVYETIDLGVTFVENITFNRHIDNIIAKANSMFGFVKRWTGEFNDMSTILVLYFSYIRSQVEYAAIVWSPYYTVHIKRIESIQKKFLLFLLKKTGWDYDYEIPFHENVARLPPYKKRCEDYKICTLENRRVLLDAAFIGNVLLGHIDSAYITENISIHVPGRILRNHNFLNLEHHCTNYGENSPINRLAKSFNKAEHQFDFNLSKVHYKNNLKNYFLHV